MKQSSDSRFFAASRHVSTGTFLFATFLGIAPSYAQDKQLEASCLGGDRQACSELMQDARSACLSGDRNACTYASDLSSYLQGQSPRQARPSERGPIPGDVYTPDQRSTVESTADYIRSYCSDPKMAQQLRAYNFCKD